MGAGLVTLDAIFDVNAGTYAHRVGGTCANVLCILGHFGIRSAIIAALGPDLPGQIIESDLRALNVDLDFVSRNATVSTRVIVETLNTRTRSHRFRFSCPVCQAKLPRRTAAPGGSTISRALSQLDGASLFFFDRLSDSALALAEHAAASGSLVMFEPASFGRGRRWERALSACHVLKYSHRQRIEFPAEGVSGPCLTIETRGHAGLRYRLGDQAEWITLPAFTVPGTQDNAGAGDWCTAGLLIGLLLQSQHGCWNTAFLTTLLTWAQALAGLSTRYVGPLGYLEHRHPHQIVDEVRNLLNGAEPTPVKRSRITGPLKQIDHGSPEDVCPLCLQSLSSEA